MQKSKQFLNNLTLRSPVGHEHIPELSPAAVVLQQSDKGGRGAWGPAQLTQLGPKLTVLHHDTDQPANGGGTNPWARWLRELTVRIPAWCALEASVFAPEQYFGPLLAGEATPCLEAADGRGDALGNVFVRGAHYGRHRDTCKKKKQKKLPLQKKTTTKEISCYLIMLNYLTGDVFK